nr:MAG TPA: hypothetical protein [Caudoviricetes sp.]
MVLNGKKRIKKRTSKSYYYCSEPKSPQFSFISLSDT